jgi:hypothetical protein
MGFKGLIQNNHVAAKLVALHNAQGQKQFLFVDLIKCSPHEFNLKHTVQFSARLTCRFIIYSRFVLFIFLEI